MKTKEFKTLDEQIEILKSRGLVINDIDKTKELLLRENYFFINGYRHIFMKNHKDSLFIPGTTFEELYAVFQFDRSFRNVLFKNLLIVENNLKSIIATLHYISNYGYVPLWILVKLLSFGMINELYSILKPDDKLAIAEYYNLDVETLGIYIALLSNYRNLCAHEDIVYDHRTQKEIPDTRYHMELDIPTTNDEYIYGKDDIFAVVIMLKYMLTENDFTDFVNEVSYELDLLDGRVNIIPQSKILDRMGFPSNWEEIAKIK